MVGIIKRLVEFCDWVFSCRHPIRIPSDVDSTDSFRDGAMCIRCGQKGLAWW